MKSILITLLLLTHTLILTDAFAISEVNYEQNDSQFVQKLLAHQSEIFNFPTLDGYYNMECIRYPNPNAHSVLVVVAGFGEPYQKYAELSYDFMQKGYYVYMCDPRGQGGSPHLSFDNRQVGHVQNFYEYADDLKNMMELFVKPRIEGKPIYLLAHSMGGAIAAQYLEKNPSPFKAVVFSAPMFQLKTSPIPEFLVTAYTYIAKSFGGNFKYAPGQHDTDCNEPFENNKVTSSLARYSMQKKLCKDKNDIAIGGASNNWVYEALSETKKIRNEINKIDTPALIFQAGDEHFVVNHAQDEACSKMKSCQLIKLETAKHEILMEQDSIRDSVINQIDQFYQKHR